jgi:hypothetical protein
MPRLVASLSLLLVLTSLARAQNQAAASSASMMMQMPMVAPLFVENGEFSTTIYMVNDLSIPATAKVILFDLDGIQIAEKTVHFNPNSQQQLSIRKLLAEANCGASMGSVQLQPQTDQGTGILASPPFFCVKFCHL